MNILFNNYIMSLIRIRARSQRGAQCSVVYESLTHDTSTIHCSNKNIKSFIQFINMQMIMHIGITSYPSVLTAYFFNKNLKANSWPQR